MTPSKNIRGFTLIETMVGVALAGLVLIGVYRVWKNHQEQSLRIERTIEARNQLALATKKVNQSITLAGLGLNGVPAIAKGDAVGSDTLFVYTNGTEKSANLMYSVHHGNSVAVDDASIFSGATFVGISNDTVGEVCRVSSRSGSYLIFNGNLANDYAAGSTKVYPATREKYYTDQETQKLIRKVDNSANIIGSQLHNFQVSFRDKDGNSTEDPAKIRTVLFSLTGEFTPTMGTVNSIVFSSTAIPRNLL